MSVYLIRAGESGPFCKIGKADDPVARMLEFQCGHYDTLVLVKTWPGDVAEEGAMHRAFSEYRHRGEWFRFTEAMLAADPAELLMRASWMSSSRLQASAVRTGGMTLEQFRRHKNLSFAELAVLLKVGGVNAARTVQRWARHERIPHRSKIADIEVVTGGAVCAPDWPFDAVPAQSQPGEAAP